MQHPDNLHTMALRTLGDVVRRSAPLVVVSPDDTVVALARVLHDKRVDAVAVLRNSDFLGLVTSRDVASCIARRDILTTVSVSQIMTAAPITLAAHDSPARALALMREGRFRHIPVLGGPSGASVIGIVDVLHLAYDAITRLQASYSMIPSRRTFDFMRAARANIEKPTLRPIVETSPLVTLSRRNTVADACEAIVKNHLAAVVIVDDDGILDGIFTCRDATTRVVAKEKDSVTLTLEEVMTSSPDCASPDFTILESLQRMQACGFRHLPVVEDHSRKVIGLVNVLQLASDTLIQTSKIEAAPRMSRSSPPPSPAGSRRGNSSTSGGGLGTFFANLFSSANYAHPVLSPQRRPPSIGRTSSSSVVAHGAANAGKRQFSTLSRRELLLQPVTSPSTASSFVSFKFRDINEEFRKVRVNTMLSPGCFDQFVIDVRRRFMGASAQAGAIKLKYIDEDGDAVLISNDEDLASCLEDSRRLKGKAVDLRVSLVQQRGSRGTSPFSSRSNSFHNSPLSNVTPKVISPPRGSAPSPSRSSTVSTQSDTRPPPTPPQATPSELKAQEAHARMMDGNIPAAITLFDSALALDPGNAFAMGGRGAARLIGGNSTGAEEDYRGAIALLDAGRGGRVGDRTFETCILGLVEALIDQRRYEEAVSVAGRADAKTGGSRCTDAFRDELESSSAAARKALEANEFGDAMSMYSNALRVEVAFLSLASDEMPRADLRIGRAKCYKMLEDYDMALEDYEAAVKIEPESVAAHKGCAFCLAEMEQMDRALEAYERAHKLDPGDEDVNKQIKLLKSLLPDPLEEKKVEIAKLGAMLGNMNFAIPKKK